MSNISQAPSYDNANTDAQTHTSQHQIACRKHNNTSAKPDKFCRITKLKRQKEKPIRKEQTPSRDKEKKQTYQCQDLPPLKCPYLVGVLP